MAFTRRKTLHPCQTSVANVEHPPLVALGSGNSLINEEVLEARRVRLPQTLKPVARPAVTQCGCFRDGRGIELFPAVAEGQGALQAFPPKEAPIGQHPLTSHSTKSHRHRF